MYLITVLLLLKDLTESAFLLGLFQFVALAPGFLLSPVTGVLVDRESRRLIMIWADLVRGVAMVAGGTALLVPGLRNPVLVLVVSGIVGAGNAFFLPAAQALIPDIVERDALQNANGARAASNQGFNLAGNALGGFLYSTYGAPLVFVLNGITFFLSALQERAIHAPADRHRRPTTSRAPFVKEARAGLAVVVTGRRAPMLFLSQAGLFLLSPALLLALPFIVIDELGYSGRVVGLFFAAALAGGVAVFIPAGRLPVTRVLRAPVIPLAYGVLAVVFGLLGVFIHPTALLLAAILFGGAAGSVYLYTVTWIQTENEPTMHGRLFALLEAGNSLVAPVSYVVIGLVLELLGAERRHWLFAAMAVLSGVWALWAIRSARLSGDDTHGNIRYNGRPGT